MFYFLYRFSRANKSLPLHRLLSLTVIFPLRPWKLFYYCVKNTINQVSFFVTCNIFYLFQKSVHTMHLSKKKERKMLQKWTDR